MNFNFKFKRSYEITCLIVKKFTKLRNDEM